SRAPRDPDLRTPAGWAVRAERRRVHHPVHALAGRLDGAGAPRPASQALLGSADLVDPHVGLEGQPLGAVRRLESAGPLPGSLGRPGALSVRQIVMPSAVSS